MAIRRPFISCIGKAQFKSRKIAEESLRHNGDASRTVYRCRFCEFWHVGGKSKATASIIHKPKEKLTKAKIKSMMYEVEETDYDS
jgi:hypothetical protein